MSLGKYLGMPLFHHRIGRNTFYFILDKVHDCLNRWDVRKLSFARRLTLLKLVFLSIPNFFMATTRIPVTICKEIEKRSRCFLWGSTSVEKKVALVKWKDIC